MADAVETAVAAEIPVAPSKGRGRLIVVVAAAFALLTGLGGAGWFFFLRPHGAPAPAHVEEEVRATLPLGSLVVNMKGEARRYLRASVSLGLPSASKLKEVEELKPQLLDLCIAVLSSTEAETLLSAKGREEVKEALVQRIRKEPGLKDVVRVYFTEFVVQ